MPCGEHSHVHFPPININQDFPLWNHPRDFLKHADALWAPDNPFSGHINLKQQHDALKHCATSQPSIPQDCGNMDFFFDADKHQICRSHEELAANFTQATSELFDHCRSTIIFDP